MNKLDDMEYRCPQCNHQRIFASKSIMKRVESQSARAERKNLIEKKYKKLYSRLPSFACKPSCHDCCGAVPFSQYEADKANTTKGLNTKGMKLTDYCKFICSDGCSIYKNRPFMCRLFGVANTPALTCPNGGIPEYLITFELAQDLTEEYIEIQKLEERMD
jgi:Fe-S-cluster containining protein